MHYDCDIAIIGGGLGGVAAALAACDAGRSVVLTEETDWIGGQITAQGVSALDEHDRIEDEPPTRAYAELRARIRSYYANAYGVPSAMPDGKPLNPGNGWVSRLCFEPHVGLAVLEDMLAPHIASGRLTILRETIPTSAECAHDRVRAVRVTDAHGVHHTIHAALFVDATELGDLLPLTDTAFVTGAESRADTGEPNALPEARPDEVQSFTYCFAVAFDPAPGASHIVDAPAGYVELRNRQPYSLNLGNPPQRFFMQRDSGGWPLPFWAYRRIFDAATLDPTGTRGLRDIALINWHGNDFHDAHLIGKTGTARAAVVDAGKTLARGFLHWLQTEAPHDDDSGFGFPNLQLLPDVMGTADGFSKTPYARESRRILARTRITEMDISKLIRNQPGDAARDYPDSVGVGWYAMDLHPAVGNPTRTMYAPTHPFQIPMGALIPVRTRNLLAACKNIGTTHLTNGAYRLHPVEWAIGEAAGALAAYCVADSIEPGAAHADATRVTAVRERLRERGVRLNWDARAGS
jgi:hypothetical protein